MTAPLPFAAFWRLALAVLVAGAFLLTALAPAPAFAEQPGEKKTIFQLLFGKKPQRTQTREKPPKKPRRTVDAGAQAVPQAVEKLPDARRILVVGDFLAKALGDGLTVAFAQSADIVIEVRSNGSSGLVRADFHDWSSELPKAIDEVKPSMVIVMLGANDRQQMTVDGKKEKFRSDIWTATYEKRIAAVTGVLAARKMPFAWVGLPPFQSEQMTADAATLNGFFRSAAERAGGEFVDIWEGFVDEGGKFAYSGSDINGQSVRLRGSDGLSFTRAGKRKLAFYVEKPIRHMLGTPLANLPLRLDTPALTPGENDLRAPVVIVSTPPMSLADPELDGGEQLLDAPMLPKGDGSSPREKLVLSGDTGVAPEGRIDDFLIRPKTTAQ